MNQESALMAQESVVREVRKGRLAWSPKEISGWTGLSLGFVRKEIIREGILALKAGRRLIIISWCLLLFIPG